MIRVAVLCPVLGRPERAQPLVDSLAASVTGPLLEARVMFLVSPGDEAQLEACRACRGAQTVKVKWEPGPGDYALKINYGFMVAATMDESEGYGQDFALLGADDLVFHPGWLEAALIAQLQTGACVVGTNDLGNPAVLTGTHATHSLVHRNYYEAGLIDDPKPGLLLNPAYDHNFVDNEFVGTAKARGTFVAALASHVEHNHPIWGKGATDATYAKGQRAYDADQRLHDERRKLWERGT